MQTDTPEDGPIEESGPTYEEDAWASRNLTAKRLIAGGGVLAAGLAAGLLVLFLVVLDDDGDGGGGQVQAPVVRDDLIDAVSSDGSIVLPERTALSFGTAGTLAELLVETGDTVQEGDAIARLDDLTLTGLEKSVEEARVALEEADAALGEARSPASELDLATAQAAIISAEDAIADAEEALAALLAPSADDLIEVAAAVTAAEVAIEDAVQTLADLEALPDLGAVEDARTAADLAQEAYDNALTDQTVTETAWAATVADSVEATESAETDYVTLFTSWLGYDLSTEQTGRQPSTILADAGIDLGPLFSPNVDDFRFIAISDDPSTPWDELTLFTWNWLSPELIEGTCGADGPRQGYRCVQDELQSSWDSLTAAIDSEAGTQATAAVALTAARKSVDSAGNALAAAIETFEDSQAPAGELDLRQTREAVALAEAGLQAASDLLAEAQSPPANAIQAARADLEIAKAELADTIVDLEDLQAIGSDQQLITLREAEVASAQAVLANAEETRDDATIRASVTGIVDVVNFEVGDELQRNSVVLEILDPTIVTLLMDVDQVDILAITVGAEASVSIDALPGQQLVGMVSDIGPAAIAGAGSVTFPVTVTVEVPQGAALLEGLSATAQVITSARADVLLVPAAAIGGSFTAPTIDVVRGGSLETVSVTLDGGNETFAVISSGVSEGDIVSFSLPDINEQANPFDVFRAGFGGGAGGFGAVGRGDFSIQAVPGGGGGGGR